jgi:tetratricopeptide (TPR) repeat protein
VDATAAQRVEEARILLDARQELYGEDDPATLDAIHHLASALLDAESFHEAESLLRTSLSIQRRSDDADEARVIQTELNLAVVLDRLGENDSARRVGEAVLEASDRTNGPESELSIRAATNLAITLRKLRRYGDEFPLRVRILESTRRSRGAEDVQTYRSMVDLAQTQRSLGNHDMALSLFTEAVSGLERNGEEPRTVLYQKWAIATELVALKRTKEAALMFDEVVAGAVLHLDPGDPLRKSAIRQQRGYRLLGWFSRFGRSFRRRRPPTP